MSPQEQLQSLINALITNGTLTDVQKSIILSHAELQGIGPEEAERMMEAALQQPPPLPPANDQSGFVTSKSPTPPVADSGSTFVSDQPVTPEIPQSNPSPAHYSGIQFGAGAGFTDVQPLGKQGAMSITQKARLDGRWVVVKRLPQAYKYNQTYAELLFKEYFNGRGLEHPHIVNIYGRGEDTDGPFFYMEYVDGEPLTRRLSEGGLKDQRLIRKIATEILDALSYAHKKQVYHRDLKPDNILITNKGDNVKIIDFGLAAADKFDDLAKATFMGTLTYAAPEQSSAPTQVDGRADLYAFGLILLEMFTGSPDPKNIKQLPVSYWRSIIDRCLHPAPADRFANAAEILEIISSHSSTLSQSPAQPGTRPSTIQTPSPANQQTAPKPPVSQPAFASMGLQKLPNDVLILVLGILSLVACGCGFIFSIITLVLSSQSDTAYVQNPSIYDPGSRQLVKSALLLALF